MFITFVILSLDYILINDNMPLLGKNIKIIIEDNKTYNNSEHFNKNIKSNTKKNESAIELKQKSDPDPEPEPEIETEYFDDDEFDDSELDSLLENME